MAEGTHANRQFTFSRLNQYLACIKTFYRDNQLFVSTTILSAGHKQPTQCGGVLVLT